MARGNYIETGRIRTRSSGVRVALVVAFWLWGLGGILAATGAAGVTVTVGALAVPVLVMAWIGGVLFLGIAALLVPPHYSIERPSDPAD